MRIISKSNLTAIVGVVILGYILTGCGKPPAGAGPAPGGPPEVAVMVVKSERAAITTDLPGRTSAYLVAEVRPQVTGIIQKRLFDEGASVKEGTVLYQIDPAPYQAAYDNAVASLAKAEANLPPIQLKAERFRKLVASQAISQQEYDDVAAALKQAEADIAYGKAGVQTARINLGYTNLTAPITGVIGRSNVTIGALVMAGQASPLAVIQMIDPVFVDVTQSSANLLQLKRRMASGQINRQGSSLAKVKLVLEDGTPYPTVGTLKFSDVTVDPSTSSYILRTVFANPEHTLLPGMYVRVILEEGVNEQAILVPQRGVARDTKGNATALVVDASDKVEQRIVKVERAIGDRWLLSEGLKPGDRLVLEGLQMAKPGSSVKVVPFKTATKEQANAGRPSAATN